jgi:hypothetical protein
MNQIRASYDTDLEEVMADSIRTPLREIGMPGLCPVDAAMIPNNILHIGKLEKILKPLGGVDDRNGDDD